MVDYGGPEAARGSRRRWCCHIRRARGQAVKIDPIKPTLKPPGTQRLKLHHDDGLLNFALKLSLRRYNAGDPSAGVQQRRLQGCIRWSGQRAHRLRVAMGHGRTTHSFFSCRLVLYNI